MLKQQERTKEQIEAKAILARSASKVVEAMIAEYRRGRPADDIKKVSTFAGYMSGQHLGCHNDDTHEIVVSVLTQFDQTIALKPLSFEHVSDLGLVH